MFIANNQKRSTRIKFAGATAAVLAGFAGAGETRAAAPVFDSMTTWLYTATLPSDFGLYFTAPNETSPFRTPDSFINGTAVGTAIVLPTGTTSLTGVDFTFANATNSTAFDGSSGAPDGGYPAYNGGSGTSFNALKITVSIWGTVTPVTENLTNATVSSMNSTGGTLITNYTNHISYTGLNASTPAFSNLISTQTILDTVDTTAPSGYVYFYSGYNQGLDGIVPGLKFNTPGGVNVAGYSTIGITYDLQGSVDGGLTYQHYAGLDPIIAADSAITAGATARNAFYENQAGETNGNFIQGPYVYHNYNSSTTTSPDGMTSTTNIDYTGAVPDLSPSTRVFGTAPPVIYHWATAADGSYSTSSEWTPTGVPAGNDIAIFNLNSSSGYAVEVGDFETVSLMQVQQDNVSINLDGQNSYLFVQSLLTVGQPATNGASIKGSLTVENTGNVYIGFLEANALAIGGNGGTGTVTLTNGAYLLTDNDTAIHSGSKLVVQPFGKFGTDTLTLDGSANAWAGQLDIGVTSVIIYDGNLSNASNQAKTGFNKGAWNGQGIISTNAATDTSHLTAVGVISNNVSGNYLYSNTATGAIGLFDGQNPGLNSVLVRYTYYGDANVDGTIDGSDYSLIDNGFLKKLTGWFNGDFNYDGVVNGSDYTLLDNAYNQQYGVVFQDFFGVGLADSVKAGQGDSALTAGNGASDLHLSDIPYSAGVSPTVNPTVQITAQIASTTGASAAVPEPTSIALLAMSAVPLLGRRNRRSV